MSNRNRSEQSSRVLLAGAIRHGDAYLHALNSLSNVDVVGILEDREAPQRMRTAADALADNWSLPRLTDLSPEDRVADLAVVCTEPTRHAAMAIRCLEAGLAVIVDKPVATNRSDLDELLDAVDRSGLPCGSITRSLGPSLAQARSWIDAGYIGFPRSANAEFLSSGARLAETVEDLDLVIDPALSGGGELMNFLGYPIDNIRFLTGSEPVELQVETTSRLSSRHAEHGVEAAAVTSTRFTNGLVASIVVGRIPHSPSSGPVASTTRVFGSHGHLLVDETQPAVDLYGPDGTRNVPIHGDPNALAIRTCLERTISAIQEESDLPYDINEAAIAVRSILAAYESEASGQPAPIELPS